MPVGIIIGLKASSIEVVSDALRQETGVSPELRDSFYVGEYDLFRMPEEVRVSPNFVASMDEWTYPAHQDYVVLLSIEDTERPDFFRALVSNLKFENTVIEEKSW